MTEKEWQERYEITSLKGRIWKRSELCKHTTAMLKTLMPGKTPLARRTVVLAVLDDQAFMRGRKGMIPACVVKDAVIEAMLRLSREDRVRVEQIAIVDKTLTEVKKENGRE